LENEVAGKIEVELHLFLLRLSRAARAARRTEPSIKSVFVPLLFLSGRENCGHIVEGLRGR
jgi:hypothetical protein